MRKSSLMHKCEREKEDLVEMYENEIVQIENYTSRLQIACPEALSANKVNVANPSDRILLPEQEVILPLPTVEIFVRKDVFWSKNIKVCPKSCFCVIKISILEFAQRLLVFGGCCPNARTLRNRVHLSIRNL